MIRIFRHYVPKSLVILGSGEAAILIASTYLGVSLRLADFNPTDKLMVGHIWTKALLFTVVLMVVMAGMGLYQRSLRDDLRGILFRVGLALLVGLVLVSIGLKVAPTLSIGPAAFTTAFVLSAAGILLFRTLVFQLAGNTLYKRRVLILGSGQMASQVEELRRKSDHQDMKLVGFVHVPGEPDAVTSVNILAIQTSLLDLALEHRVDEIVVAVDERRENFPIEQILDCKMSGIRILDLVTFFEQQTGKIKLEALNPSSMIFADGFIQAVVKNSLHRMLDVLLSLGVLAIAWPFMLLIASLIWAESRGRAPVLYRQVRVGRDGRNFPVLKFRSMEVDAEKDGEAQWAARNDTRVTLVGSLIRKSRIDELPQLINVLKGDMSFVGPRPERPEFVAELEKKIPYYGLRHRVNPGITGWAQICYPYGSSERDAKEKLQFDLYYIKNYSLFLDLMILIQTAQVILWGKGAR